jgi:aminopeptidase N
MTKDQPPKITEAEATWRAKQVQNVNYDLEFNLQDSKSFAGTSSINFDLTTVSNGLRIDYHDGAISSLIVNGKTEKPTYNSHFLWIGPQNLKVGSNKIVVDFESPYSKEGNGLHQFRDPEDKRRYLYTDLEPFDANRVFPMFDQPDLKATYTMKVTVPKNWKVITSVRESNVKASGGGNVWTFPKSAKFSTYIWSLHAGDYAMWEDNSGETPLRLFARQSLKKYVKHKDWFKFTHDGFKFFNAYFDYKYPYKKYDQLIVPEFNAGAMENVGAVTFTEGFVSRGVKSERERMSLNNVILHEMAHMWFGNLVTMKWWNDLWLNESFATYMAHLAQVDNTEFKTETWKAFNGTKGWAYWEDELVTTHPIEANVPDTLQAWANFDGITYGKGASSMKQLSYFIGANKFKLGVQKYFKKYAEKNTTLRDFMGSLSEAAGQDLTNWQEKWLQTSGVNTITAKFQCESGKVSRLTLAQDSLEKPRVMRPHSLNVAFLNLKDDKFSTSETFRVRFSSKSFDVAEAVGKNCPDVVYPNYEDHGYVKVELDDKTVQSLRANISKVEDDLLRRMFWNTLRDMVVHAQLSFEDFSETLLSEGLKKESDPFILRQMLYAFKGRGVSSPSVLNFYRIKAGGTLEFEQVLKTYEDVVWSRLKKAKAKSEQQKIFFGMVKGFFETKSGLKKLNSLLSGRTQFRGLKIDQDDRWQMLWRLSALDYPGATKMLEKEKEKDASHQGQLSYLSAKASTPKWETKKEWITKLTNKGEQNYSYAEFKAVVGALFPSTQTELRNKYSSEFYSQLLKLNNSKDTHLARTFLGLAPNECASDEKKLEGFIKQNKGLKAPVLKGLRILNQEFERCRKAIEMATTKQKKSS